MAWRQRLAASLLANADSIASRWPQLATVALDGSPAVRTLAFRGFLDDLIHTNPNAVLPALIFITDARSDKIREILRKPKVELCWYFPDTREQYRISGTAAVLMPMSGTFSNQNGSSIVSSEPDVEILAEPYKRDKILHAFTLSVEENGSAAMQQLRSLRNTVWSQLSQSARAQFLWPLASHNTPGEPPGSNLALDLPGQDKQNEENGLTNMNREALKNFAVLMVLPERVRILDLRIAPFGIWEWKESSGVPEHSLL